MTASGPGLPAVDSSITVQLKNDRCEPLVFVLNVSCIVTVLSTNTWYPVGIAIALLSVTLASVPTPAIPTALSVTVEPS